MIYIYTEDKKEGLTLIKNAVDLYLDAYNISTGTIDGIKNLAIHIRNLQLNKNDIVYYIYDNVSDNSYVLQHLKNANTEMVHSKYQLQIRFIPIFCCEHAILSACGIEAFANKNSMDAILELKEYHQVENLTLITKANRAFDKYYNIARRKRENTLKRKVGQAYSLNDIEIGVTAEKLYKEIFKEAFIADLAMNNGLGKCWNNDCCIKKKKICSMHINCRKLQGIEKSQYLADGTVYFKIIQQIAIEQNLELRSRLKVNLGNIKFDKTVLEIMEEHKRTSERRVQKCAKFIKEKVLGYNELHNEYDIINECLYNGYTESQAKRAIERIIKEKR